MRPNRARKKKLRLALHFHRSRTAGWSCEDCRRQDLERVRNCAFLPEEARAKAGKIVWISGEVTSENCPRSVISAESLTWIEMFSLGYRATNREEADARDAEALAWLEKWTREGEGDGSS